MHNADISIDNLTKIEGHASLDIKVRNNKVKYVKFRITENKRFFTQAIKNKPIIGLGQHVSRICGTCSIAHLLCSIEAVEKALGIKPSSQTMALRNLSMYGLMIRDHALHLYLFSLPDELGKDSILELNKTHHSLIHDAFAVKSAGNKLSTLVAGKAVHAPYPVIGGFSTMPQSKDKKPVIEGLERIRPKVLGLIDIFYKSRSSFTRNTDFVALVNKNYSFLEGSIKSSEGYTINEKNYYNHLTKTVIPYSEAVGYKFNKKDYMVGALSRLNLNKGSLHERTRKDASKYLDSFPSSNIFHNNLAQAIEILHSIDHSIDLLEKTDFKKETPKKMSCKDSSGIGVLEAPRGTLYYHLSVKNDGLLRNCKIVVPTQQNQINMEHDIHKLVQDNIRKKRSFIVSQCERLIRAYDPCMSCATHFLKVKWM